LKNAWKEGPMTVQELDVRHAPKPQRHPQVFELFAALPPSGSFVLINGHDPKHLHQEFQRDYPGSFGWEYLQAGPDLWRIQITKVASTAVPQIRCDAHALLAGPLHGDPAGAIWQLQVSERQLDANIIHLRPEEQIGAHDGPDLDVLVLVLAGSGEMGTAAAALPLSIGTLAWLPRRSRRSISAGDGGLSYLTVHTRRPALRIEINPDGQS
jgi:uncharacterized protein (DUF2249 family)